MFSFCSSNIIFRIILFEVGVQFLSTSPDNQNFDLKRSQSADGGRRRKEPDIAIECDGIKSKVTEYLARSVEHGRSQATGDSNKGAAYASPTTRRWPPVLTSH